MAGSRSERLTRAERGAATPGARAAGAAPLSAAESRPWRDVLACLPLLLAYELAVANGGGALRNGSDLLLSLPLRPLADAAWIARAGLLAAAVCVAIGRVHRSEQPLLEGWVRIAAESLLAALVLGPLLLIALRLVPQEARELGLSDLPAGELPQLSRVGLIAGGAVFEELVFRVGIFGLVYLAVRRAALFLGANRVADWIADACAVSISALCFASFHLSAYNAWLGAGGEEFHSSLYAWRTGAGVALALLWRWRGFAVAAWTHALFNVALLLGAGPGVLL
jgi:hypothetical protein